jgi:hypothetical protein
MKTFCHCSGRTAKDGTAQSGRGMCSLLLAQGSGCDQIDQVLITTRSCASSRSKQAVPIPHWNLNNDLRWWGAPVSLYSARYASHKLRLLCETESTHHHASRLQSMAVFYEISGVRDKISGVQDKISGVQVCRLIILQKITSVQIVSPK